MFVVGLNVQKCSDDVDAGVRTTGFSKLSAVVSKSMPTY